MPSHLLSIKELLSIEEIQTKVEEVDWSPGDDENSASSNQETVSPPPSARLTRHSGVIRKESPPSLVQTSVTGGNAVSVLAH